MIKNIKNKGNQYQDKEKLYIFATATCTVTLAGKEIQWNADNRKAE
jgi:hypothetical protein